MTHNALFRLCLVFEYDDVINHGHNSGCDTGDNNGDDDDSAEQWHGLAFQLVEPGDGFVDRAGQWTHHLWESKKKVH